MPNRQGWTGTHTQQAKVGRTHIQQAETDEDRDSTNRGKRGLIASQQRQTETHT